MLSRLHIENIAVIEAADISFAPGFNVLTGETGAGKSIVVDAIGAVTGERVSRDLVRTGAKTAVAEAVFTLMPVPDWLAEEGLSPAEDGSLILRREVGADGRSVCYAGGKKRTVAQLAAIGSRLLNIHGQHNGRLLLDESTHLTYLDRFGDCGGLLADYRAAYEALNEIDRAKNALIMDEAEKARRIDTLNHQIHELESAELRPGEDEALRERRDLLRNAEKLFDAMETAVGALSGTEDTDGAVALAEDASRAIGRAAGMSSLFAPAAEQLEQLCILARSAEEELRALRQELSFSPEELDDLESRMDRLYRLQKKYGGSVEEMLDYLERCRQELTQITCAEDEILRLEQERVKTLREARKRAETLSRARKEAAGRLEERCRRELADLDMGKIRFAVEFSEAEGQDGLSADGMDDVCFLMSANTGETMRALSRVASGGELSRIMLALTNVLAENDDVGILVFDEVDTGVSGRAARKIAEKLSCVAAGKQVLCVTHLPQIAAMADRHFSVEKEERGGRTYTKILALDREQRRAELARITGGVEVTETLLRGAEELLCSAEEYKRRGT
ncbi:MAG: DNA repair protein RecN [Oscillospiraceae bacterium]|nr:DNA repair protein RecN [Oscillospiraceae bacterium]